MIYDFFICFSIVNVMDNIIICKICFYFNVSLWEVDFELVKVIVIIGCVGCGLFLFMILYFF